MSTLRARLGARLGERVRQDLTRRRLRVDSRRAARILVDGRELVDFCSNDYLGLATDPELAGVLADAAADWGTGAGASHLVSGHAAPHEAAEERIAEMVGAESSLLFSSGYMANLGAITALAERDTTLVCDRLNHASLIDGARLSRARVRRYAHCDHAAAADMLQAAGGNALLVTDSVFSMDGDIAPLGDLQRAADRCGALMLVDDAHGFGVLGDGRGVFRHAGIDPGQVMVGTLGKAAGVYGAFVASSREVIEAILQFARSYTYTTALPPALAVAIGHALGKVQAEQWRRERLQQNIARFRAAAGAGGLQLADSATPIQPLVTGDAARALALSAALRQRGFLVTAIRPPTVPAGTARLRIALSAAHAAEDIDGLAAALIEAVGHA